MIMITSKWCEISPWSLAKKNPQSMSLKGHVAPVTIFLRFFPIMSMFFWTNRPHQFFGSFGANKALVTRSNPNWSWWNHRRSSTTGHGCHVDQGALVSHPGGQHCKPTPTVSHMQIISLLHGFITGWWVESHPFENYLVKTGIFPK